MTMTKNNTARPAVPRRRPSPAVSVLALLLELPPVVYVAASGTVPGWVRVWIWCWLALWALLTAVAAASGPERG